MCVYTHMQAHMQAHTKSPNRAILNSSGAEKDTEPWLPRKPFSVP